MKLSEVVRLRYSDREFNQVAKQKTFLEIIVRENSLRVGQGITL